MSDFLQRYNTLLERREEAMSMAKKIQRKMNKIKQNKDVLMYYFKKESFL